MTPFTTTILSMWLPFFKECIVSLIFPGINLLSLSTTFLWPQIKLRSASQQCFGISFFLQSQFLTDLLCSSEHNFKTVYIYRSRLPCSSINFINDIVFIFCNYSIFWFTKYLKQCFQCRKWILFCEIWVYAIAFH